MVKNAVSFISCAVMLVLTCHFSFGQHSRCGVDVKFMRENKLKKELFFAKNSPIVSPFVLPDTLVVPVVVHVVYNTSAQNISDEQIKSQIDALNEDFAAENGTTADIPDSWRHFITDSKIRFQLASRDPNGNATNGITRTQTPVASFALLSPAVKQTAAGGEDPWPMTDYLNIWVCNLTQALGYSTFPNPVIDPDDGIVINYLVFGRTGRELMKKYRYGRSVTHEVGHWFGLYHIWDDDGGGCSSNFEDISDTPLQADATYGNPKYPKYDACTPNGDGIMFTNYMDYTDDIGMSFFTPGQIAKIWSYIDSLPFYRDELFASLGCVAPAILNYDLSLEVVYPLAKSLTRCFQPVVRIKNNGLQTVNSFTLQYNIYDKDKITSTKSLAVTSALTSGTDTLITLQEIAGTDELNILEVRINSTDSNTVNNYVTRSFNAGEEQVAGCDDDDPLVYPNPVTGTSVCVKSNYTKSGELTIRLVNLLGQLINEQITESNPGDVFSIDLSNQPKGIYLVQMVFEEEKSRGAKIIYIPSGENAVNSTCN